MAAGRLLGSLGILAVAVVTAVGSPGLGTRLARADQPMIKYVGMHPLPPHQGEFCFIDEIHYHRFLPVDLRVYLTLKDGGQVYLGDPAWLGYDGPKVGYFGPHPLAVPLAPEAGPLFCYIAGPHYHAVAPAPSPLMVLKDGVYWYLGPPPPVDMQRSWINEVHAIKGYAPPPVNVAAAPPGYHVFQLGGAAPPVAVAAGPSAARPGAVPGITGAGGSAGMKAPRPGVRGVKPPVSPAAVPGGAR
jgi:hypothetical protein